MKASELFNLPASLPFSETFDPDLPPWEWVSLIEKALDRFEWPEAISKSRGSLFVEGPVFIHPSVHLPPFATIIGPAYIGAGTEIRPGAYIRGNVIVGENCILGNACEFKNVLLMDDVHVPHFSYAGDSILGNRSHLGAGVVLSNLRFDQADVSVVLKSGKVSTGRMKLGAMLGDGAEVGCNSVLQPGTILGKNSAVVPAIAFGGTLEAGRIARTRTSTVSIPRIG
ncbi:MAG TPA: UDP-N-acetylglucosamine diphosphorylase [Opitutales bacterium]|nr:UDP-N-acetylglucosamine diphosphorylase [Opitutales bacterium]